ncbi:MAG TPA: hypothetical protein VH170_02085 [Chthoniobacterales bacterium]|jgi:hypothetical protein|nr:hypothetical protein [Chthoniobacterales bacterium]
MNNSARLAILGTSTLLCVAGIFVANSKSNQIREAGFGRTPVASVPDEYQLTLSRAAKLSFQELEKIIRRDAVAKAQRGKLEFGSVKMERDTAIAEVMFVTNDGYVQPFLYKLLPDGDSWKIVNVQRMWFVPRSRLLRGVRA